MRGATSAPIRKLGVSDPYARQGRNRESWGIDDFRGLVIVPTEERAHCVSAKIAMAGASGCRFIRKSMGPPFAGLPR